MPSKTPELKAREKQIKEEKRHAEEAARRERAKAVVDAAKCIGSFRVMNSEAEILLKAALDKLDDSSKYVVSVDKSSFDRNIYDNFALICEELQQYGMVTAYMLLGTWAQLTLSDAGKIYFDEKKAAESNIRIEDMAETVKKPMLLISHSSSDKKYADALITLFESIGLNQTHMVCSSIPGYGIPLGKDVYEWLASRFTELDLHVVFILSDRYYSSAPCLNEMGAAWITKSEYTSILLPGFDFSQIRGAINPNQISIKLDSEEDELKQRLNELKDNLTERFGVTKITDSRWERFRSVFIDAINCIKSEQESNRIRTNQPAFAIKIEAINEQLPGTADILNADFTGGTKHNNLQFSIEIINERPARNLIVFNKLLTSVLKPGEKCGMSVAYEDSEDIRKWPSKAVKILHSEYEEENGLPSWFNICYQDEEGHNMVQSAKLQSYEGDYYYDLDGYPWEA